MSQIPCECSVSLRRMRMKFTFDDAVLIVAGAAVLYFRNWWTILFFVVVIAYAILRYFKSRKSETPADTDDNEFVIENKDEMQYTAELDVGLNYRSLPNHFRTDYRYDTSRSKSLYEYRLEGTDVLIRLIEDWHEDIGVPKYHDVRDGVVLESELRKRDAERSFHITDVEAEIADLKKNAEWHKMDSLTFHGLKYFIISRKLPQADARRYLRQELERLKIGTAALLKEAEKYGLEPNEDSLDRLKVSEGKTKPSNEEIRKLYATESLG